MPELLRASRGACHKLACRACKLISWSAHQMSWSRNMSRSSLDVENRFKPKCSLNNDKLFLDLMTQQLTQSVCRQYMAITSWYSGKIKAIFSFITYRLNSRLDTKQPVQFHHANPLRSSQHNLVLKLDIKEAIVEAQSESTQHFRPIIHCILEPSPFC